MPSSTETLPQNKPKIWKGFLLIKLILSAFTLFGGGIIGLLISFLWCHGEVSTDVSNDTNEPRTEPPTNVKWNTKKQRPPKAAKFDMTAEPSLDNVSEEVTQATKRRRELGNDPYDTPIKRPEGEPENNHQRKPKAVPEHEPEQDLNRNFG